MEWMRRRWKGQTYHVPAAASYCPDVFPTKDELLTGPRPLLVDNIPMEHPVGVPMRDVQDVLVDVPPRWPGGATWRRARKRWRDVTFGRSVYPMGDLDVGDVITMLRWHFQHHPVTPAEIEALLEYGRGRKCVEISARTSGGDLVFTTLLVWMGDEMLREIACSWNPAHHRLSPGTFSIVHVAETIHELGARFYNIGPLQEHKQPFRHRLRSRFGAAVFDAPLRGPLLDDKTSPLHRIDPLWWNTVDRQPLTSPITVQEDLRRYLFLSGKDGSQVTATGLRWSDEGGWSRCTPG